MDLDLVFLGTSGAMPTPQRGLTSLLIRRGGERILVDCGEGTQRQMMRSTGLSDVDMVLITHGHADHILGLPGMLKTFSLRERDKPLTIVGPPRFSRLMQQLKPIYGRLSFPLEVLEVGDGWASRRDGYAIDAFLTDHSVASIGFRLREFDRPGRFDIETARALGVEEGPMFGRLQRGESVPGANGRTVEPSMVLGPARTGRRVVVTGDTRACAAVRDVALDATVLVHEATFGSEEAQRALDTGHSTARDAALTAATANVSMLAITHLSNRYGGRELLEEAREVFPNTVCPRDFDALVVPYAERGEPQLVKGGGRPDRAGGKASGAVDGASASAQPAPSPVAGS